MLSKVAERVYWMARYIERAENTARLINVHHGLLLDLPADANIGWEPLLEILACRQAYEATESSVTDERALQSFIITDEENPSSLLSSLHQARENARTTRDLMPNEAWRAVNELLLFAEDKLTKEVARKRHDVLTQIVGRCQAINGLLAGTMSQGAGYQFLRAGRNLERADMTTRLIDVAAAILMPGQTELKRYYNTLWMAILRSTSAYQMYRQHVRRRVSGPDVIAYLFKDTEFPRAVSHCLVEVEHSLSRLPRPDTALATLAKSYSRLRDVDTMALDIGGIHKLIDDLQLDIARVHSVIHATWFLPEETIA